MKRYNEICQRPDKDTDTIDGDGPKRNVRSLSLNGVTFQADKKLVRNTRSLCRLERACISRVRRSPYTTVERLRILKVLKS